MGSYSLSSSRTLESEGRVWFRNAVSRGVLAELDQLCTADVTTGKRLGWSAEFDRLFGSTSEIGALVRSVLPGANPARVVSFNKRNENNWALPWHQDRVIAVDRKHEIGGFSNWSQKCGVWHCEPPITLLEDMVFVRVHLDEATDASGSLELALGTHALGFIPANEAASVAETSSREICRAARGDVLIIKMLTLHRSAASKTGSDRRALRVDYSSDTLPAPLNWATI